MPTERRVVGPGDDWDALRAGFRWAVPARFNIAERCCTSWARADPDRLAITHLDGQGGRQDWSYGALEAASNRLANAFRARGLGRGDRVAVLLSQSPEVIVTHFAAYKLGAVVLPLFTLFGPEALAYRLSDSGARIVVTDPENRDKLMALVPDLPELREVYCTGPAPVPAPLRGFEAEIAAASDDLQPVDTAAEDPAVLIYTSGTTGAPKGVLHAHRFLLGHLPSMELTHARFPQPGDRGWTPADWAWIGGLMDMAMPCLYYGVAQLSGRMRKFDPEEAYGLIAREGLRTLFLPPTALKLMRAAPVPQGVDIRTISSGGEHLGAEILDWGQTALGAPINEIYGQTECNLVISMCRDLMAPRDGAMGKALPGHEVAVLDSDGTPVRAGALGEIAVRAPDPVMFLRYWNKPEETAAKFHGDWLRTGDLGRRDGEGYFSFEARDDDVITSSGYRVGPGEIENCLMGHPDVVMAAAIGVPDPLRTEVVKAFVVLREGASWEGLEEALIARVRARVSPHVAPRWVERAAALPMTATGKIMRRELRGK